MGIRIKKMLGYGLTDLQCTDRGAIIDHRINMDSTFVAYSDFSKRTNPTDYLDWLLDGNSVAEHGTMDTWLAKRYEKEGSLPDGFYNDWYSHIVHGGGDYGQDNVLCIRPLSARDWYRNDDIIDYTEADFAKDWAGDVRVLDTGIYPYTPDFMDAVTGEHIKWDDLQLWTLAKNDESERPVERMDELAQLAGYKDHNEALSRVVPNIPDTVRDMCIFGKLFTDDRYINDLRPMIYTYWS